MVFDLIVSALVTVLVVMLTDGILTFFGNGLMNIGYRSAWIGQLAVADAYFSRISRICCIIFLIS